MTDRFQVDMEDFDDLEETLHTRSQKNRPRTKRRPAHDDAVEALVVAVDRGRYTVVRSDRSDAAAITTSRARELRRDSIVVGDRVDVVGDLSGDVGSLARIVRIHPRRNVLRRSADDSDRVERILVANVDYLVMVVAAKDPEPRLRLIDRYLVAALDQGIDPILCVTKTDLHPETDLRDYVSALDVPVVAVAPGDDDPGVFALRERLSGAVSVLVGHSGVGKSSLVNRLVPGADRAVGGVNSVTGRGRHTSSSSVALALPEGGWVIDTPGVRSFGLGHVTPDSIIAGFPDLVDAIAECPRQCSHGADQEGCGLTRLLASGTADHTTQRIDSLRRLLGVHEEAAQGQSDALPSEY